VKLSAVIGRLADIEGVRAVEDVLAVADLATSAVAMPALFVIPAGEQSGDIQEGSSVTVVQTVISFDVAILLSAAAARGRNRDELETIKAAVIERLLGRTPQGSAGEAFRPVVPVSGRLAEAAGGRVLWVHRFRTVTNLRSLS